MSKTYGFKMKYEIKDCADCPFLNYESEWCNLIDSHVTISDRVDSNCKLIEIK